MSFSKDIKSELYGTVPKSRHCQLAELAGILCFNQKENSYSKNPQLSMGFVDEFVARKSFTLLKKTLNINSEIKDDIFHVQQQLNEALHFDERGLFDQGLIARLCCRRSFVRGVFLVAGSISNPTKGYHFEVVTGFKEHADFFVQVLESFGLEPKLVVRKGKYVVYLKEGGQLVELLRIMDAPKSVMALENIRVMKEISESVNRKVNCETANISKTVGAAVRQIEDIHLLEEHVGLDALPENLQQIANLRLENPEASLVDLGLLVKPPLGKSGVNHRFKKISELANKYRAGEI